MMIYPHASIATHQHANTPTYQHWYAGTYRQKRNRFHTVKNRESKIGNNGKGTRNSVGLPVLQAVLSLQERGNHSRLQRQSKHGALCRLKGQALRRFPINLPLASLRAYLSGKPCTRPPHAKEPLKTETTDPPPTDRKGKNKVGLRTSKRQGQPPPKGKRADGRHAAGYLRRKYRSLLGNFPSRNTPYR